MSVDTWWHIAYFAFLLLWVRVAVAIWILARRYLFGELPKVRPTIEAIHARLEEMYPGADCFVAMRAVDGSPGTATIAICINAAVFPRLPNRFAFDLDIPLDAMRPMGRRRRSICAELVGEPTPENFTSFGIARVRRVGSVGEMVPIDLDRLWAIQGIVWAEAYRCGWPILCPDVVFESFTNTRLLGGGDAMEQRLLGVGTVGAGVVDQPN